jgi:hypothetical protein
LTFGPLLETLRKNFALCLCALFRARDARLPLGPLGCAPEEAAANWATKSALNSNVNAAMILGARRALSVATPLNTGTT